ncbi:hypothetical protein NQ318_004144 [Aromia moschata]|uniref:Uncharacterized protein n=1 Tax=Aromia moschata TaxID=1265417 RepID=A0AAV8YM18_9CUCU|nr:hypothetical protein NQ318_004144 [Aromia moschata]
MRQLLNPDEQLIPNTEKKSANVNDEFNEVISKQIEKDFDKSTGPTGESRPQRESVLNNPINEPPQIRISIKAEPIDEIDVAVFNSNISNKEIEAVTIKVEDIQHNSTKKQTTSECSEETYTAKILDKSVDKFIPDVENNIGVKQEVEFNYTMPELSYESESPSVTETENNVLLPKSQESPEETLVDKEKYGIPFIKPNEIMDGNNLDHSNLRSYTDAIIQTEESLHDLPGVICR